MNPFKNFSTQGGMSRFLLFFVVFLSGFCALVYQIVWIRKFGLVFGVHVFSMAAVLTAFMTGLALGSLYFGRLVDKLKSPLLLFLFLEMGIAAFAILFPLSFQGLSHLYSFLATQWDLSGYSLQLLRFFIAFLFLLIPTTLMGGTLPVIIRILTNSISNLGLRVSSLYGINNLGAVFGGFFAGFFLIQNIGMYPSVYIAAAGNLLNVLFLYWMVKTAVPVSHENHKGNPSSQLVKLSPATLRIVLWVFGIEGFTTLAYEVIWSRILIDFSVDKTVYFTSTIVVSFIFGLSLGSFLISRVLDRNRHLLTILGVLEILIGLLSVFLLLVFVWIAPELSLKRSMLDSWIQVAGREYFIFFLLLTPPTLLMGITYPLVSKLANDNLEHLGKRMGLLGFLDTIGSVAGSFVAGFIMIPFIGVLYSFMVTVVINLCLGLWVILKHPEMQRFTKIFISAGTLVLALALYLNLPSETYIRSWWDRLEFKNFWENNHYDGILFIDEGASGTVTVRSYPQGLALNINGHNTAYATQKDLKVNRQLGYMPYLLHPHPRRALVIGFGMGATTCSLVQPEMEQIDVAEICPGVIRAASIFNPWNRDVVHHPKVNIIDDDGRSVVFRAKEKYDIITSNAIHPRLSNNIYTKDFYKICREKLTEDGIICQWMPQNWLTEEEYLSLLKAFVDVFPHSTLWYVNEYSTHIIGTKSAQKIEVGRIMDQFRNNSLLRADFEEVGIKDPYQFISQFWMDEEELNLYVKGKKTNTDNYPLVEFSKVINISPVEGVMEMLRDHPVDYASILSYRSANDSIKVEEMQLIRKYEKYEKGHINSIIQNIRAFNQSGRYQPEL